MFVIAYEKDLLSVPAGQAEVLVLRIQDDRPKAKNLDPAWFRYVVALPDGTSATFVSDQIQPVGAKLLVTVSHGRITKRVWLSPPYRVLSEPGEVPGVR